MLGDGTVSLVPSTLVAPEVLYEVCLLGGGADWRFRGMTPTIEQFTAAVRGGTVDLAVVDVHGSSVVGFMGLHAVDERSRVASVSGFIDQRRDDAAELASRAALLFAGYCLGPAGFRKLMLEVPEGQERGLRALDGHLRVVEEGRLSEHVLLRGVLKDLRLFAVSRASGSTGARSAGLERAEVLAVIADVAEVDPLTVEEGFQLVADLGMESLQVAELLVALEDLRPEHPLDAAGPAVLTVRGVLDWLGV